MKLVKRLVSGVIAFTPSIVLAAEPLNQVQQSVQNVGSSALWILANISYAGMRAQNSPHSGWRVLSFIFGFPGTFLTFLVVKEGAERAYGIDLPKQR